MSVRGIYSHQSTWDIIYVAYQNYVSASGVANKLMEVKGYGVSNRYKDSRSFFVRASQKYMREVAMVHTWECRGPKMCLLST